LAREWGGRGKRLRCQADFQGKAGRNADKVGKKMRRKYDGRTVGNNRYTVAQWGHDLPGDSYGEDKEGESSGKEGFRTSRGRNELKKNPPAPRGQGLRWVSYHK